MTTETARPAINPLRASRLFTPVPLTPEPGQDPHFSLLAKTSRDWICIFSVPPTSMIFLA